MGDEEMDLAAAGTLVYRFGVLACDMMRQEEALCHGGLVASCDRSASSIHGEES